MDQSEHAARRARALSGIDAVREPRHAAPHRGRCESRAHHAQRRRGWYARIIDLNGGKPTVETGFDAFAELEESFEAMPPSAIHDLAVKYGASYVLWPSTGRALPYEKLYDDGIWSVLRIRQ